MFQRENAFFSWSGGKDSALFLYKVMQSKQYNLRCLLTNINSLHNRISMHGVRKNLLQMQAASIGIPLQTIELPAEPSMEVYEAIMLKSIKELKANGCNKAIFGDIFLEDLKLYREQQLNAVDIECIFPLWKIDTAALIKEFIDTGFKAIIVCINENYLDKSFCGRMIDETFINDLPGNVNVCGENGEFHSFVFDGPIFSQPIGFNKGEIVHKLYDAPKKKDTDGTTQNRYGFWFCDLLPA